MTSTTAENPPSSSAAVGWGLFDADGHVHEDVPAIIARMPDKWREGRERVVNSDMAKLHGMSIFPPLGYLSTIPTLGKSTQDRGPQEHGRDPESWQFFLDAIGIERTVLYPTLGLTVGRVRDLDYSVVVTRAYNDWIADTYVHHPCGRFQAAALIPMQSPLDAVTELRRAVLELGLKAAVLPAHGLPNHLGSEMFFPVYEAAQELDVALACHGGIHDGFGFDDLNVFGPIHALGFPVALLICLGGMIFNRVFDLFPRLRVAFLEGGAAWILLAAERFSESWASTGSLSSRAISLKEGTSIRDYLSELLHDGRVVIGCEGGEHQLVTTMRYFDCAPFMYSSDFPHEVSVATCLHELEELNELDIDDEAKRLLRGGTARRFYQL
jgi:predicted TIM-barrel fold metal-dependent hydrolase